MLAAPLLAAAIAFSTPATQTEVLTSFADLSAAFHGKLLDYDVASAWQGCSSELIGRIYSTMDHTAAAAHCASAALTACSSRRRLNEPASLVFCLDAEVKIQATVAVASTRSIGITDLTAADAKAAVESRLVNNASTLNGAHGPKRSDDFVVCERTPVIGSNIPGPPVCATKREWRERSATAASLVQDVQQRTAAFGGPPT